MELETARETFKKSSAQLPGLRALREKGRQRGEALSSGAAKYSVASGTQGRHSSFIQKEAFQQPPCLLSSCAYRNSSLLKEILKLSMGNTLCLEAPPAGPVPA